jgi:hypothetical protein
MLAVYLQQRALHRDQQLRAEVELSADEERALRVQSLVAQASNAVNRLLCTTFCAYRLLPLTNFSDPRTRHN